MSGFGNVMNCPIVRTSHDSVTFCTPEAFRSIYDTKANVQKARQYGIWPKELASPNTFSVIDKEKHARKRRVMTAAISESAVRTSEPFVFQHADRWGELLVGDRKNEWSEPRNMSEWSDSLVFDIICDLCFGRSFDTKTPGPNKLRSIPHDILQFLIFAYNVIYSPFADIWLWMKPKGLDKLMLSQMPSSIKQYLEFVDASVRQRVEEENAHDENGTEPTRKDMLHYLIHARDPETGASGYDFVELREETDLLIVAGFDTTAAVLAALFFYLVQNPHVLEKVQHEVRSAFKHSEEVRSGAQLAACTYLRAAIDETMRMNPPSASDMLREVLPGGLRIAGTNEIIPPGINVGTPLYALHHDAEIFPEPFRFRPERWIADKNNVESIESVQRAEAALFPFLMGIRGCPGKSLAKMEMLVISSRLLFSYDLRGEPGDVMGAGRRNLIWGRRNKSQFQTKDAMVPLRDGPMVQFRPRA
ncbi:Cytochrome P450 monooxygenase apf7 [Lachnellula suecica]|uniref:Cytochrome P450 monooxygenase apf7 n=1 Tax=Lachnellula suecica TaxID=602035 RepID=A0A8T9CKJ1_9HELO|nr:Cytochrome P450 monooxygenase apf7 [Lachnellula suecica]